MVVLNTWVEIAAHVKRVVLLWLGEFDVEDLHLKPIDVDCLFV
jgi:hypothetical protein